MGIQERRKKKEKNPKKTSQDLTAARRILRTHIPFVSEKKHQTNSKKSFPPSLCFLLLIFSYSIFSLSSTLHIKLEKKRSITNQEDGTSFPPHKILKHLKDLKIPSDPKILNFFSLFEATYYIFPPSNVKRQNCYYYIKQTIQKTKPTKKTKKIVSQHSLFSDKN